LFEQVYPDGDRVIEDGRGKLGCIIWDVGIIWGNGGYRDESDCRIYPSWISVLVWLFRDKWDYSALTIEIYATFIWSVTFTIHNLWCVY
jgi:hypothetical protein